MSIIGTFHQTALYGLISAIICLVSNKISIQTLIDHATKVTNFQDFFICFMFWSSVLFIPIGIIGAFATKYSDGGEGLSFQTDNVVVAFFAHIAEDILGLVLSPFWFLKYLFTGELTFWRVVDFIVYVAELIIIIIGLVGLFK